MTFKKQYLNPPQNARVTGKPVPMTDFIALRAYAHSLRTPEDVQYHSEIDAMDIGDLRKWYEAQGFTWTPLDESNWHSKEDAEA